MFRSISDTSIRCTCIPGHYKLDHHWNHGSIKSSRFTLLWDSSTVLIHNPIHRNQIFDLTCKCLTSWHLIQYNRKCVQLKSCNTPRSTRKLNYLNYHNLHTNECFIYFADNNIYQLYNYWKIKIPYLLSKLFIGGHIIIYCIL